MRNGRSPACDLADTRADGREGLRMLRLWICLWWPHWPLDEPMITDRLGRLADGPPEDPQ